VTEVSKEFAAVMLALAETFRVSVSEQRYKLYAEALSDLSQADIERAAARAMRECRWFPTPKELREFIEPSIDDAALIAWTGFQRAASDVGAWSSLTVEDPIAALTLNAVFGDWPSYCSLEGAAVGARKAEFLATYRNLRRLDHRLHDSVTLSGLAEQVTPGRLTVTGEVKMLPEARRALPEAGKA
jgi:hypothetical protein